ncbi:MAG: glycerol-3-phosphate 1-O-acyltransferase PlsY [Candidatus Puniceispirillaceae bacterium]
MDILLLPLPILILAYLAGSIPFGLVVTRLAGAGDIRQIGSGNIGATNVLRTGNKLLAALTLVGDAGKGAAVVVAITLAGGTPLLIAIAGVASVVGHCFPLWLKFKGGKGIATNVAVFAAFDIRLGFAFAVLWLGTAAVTRYSSLAALVATLGCSITAFWLGIDIQIAIAVLVMSALSWARHHQNIGRLLTGAETRIGDK